MFLEVDMRQQKFVYFVLILLACSPVSLAQDHYTFSTFTAANGPISSEISVLFQDTRNYIWMGHTAGVSRYDGLQFENFLFASGQQVGATHAIAEDANGNLWIGSELGLFLWKDEQLKKIATGGPDRPVYALQSDQSGGLWLGNSDGPFYLSHDQLLSVASSGTMNLSKYKLAAWHKKFPKINLVKHISTSDDHSVYFSDGYAVYQYLQNNIKKIWESSGRLDQLEGFCAINKDCIFICSLEKGIMAIEKGILRKGGKTHFHSKQIIKDGEHFLVLTNDGIYQTDPLTLAYKKILTMPEFANTWGQCFLKDHESNFWIGCNGQLNYATRNFLKPVTINGKVTPRDFYAVFQLNRQQILFGANHGESFLLSKENLSPKFWRQIFPHSAVTAFYKSATGQVWVASAYEGLALVSNERIKRFTKHNGLRDHSNFLFLENQQHELYTAGDGGVTQIIQQENGEVYFKNYPYHTGSSDYIVIKSGVALDNRLLFGSNRGVFELKNKHLQPVDISGAAHQHHHVTDIIKDDHHNIWISTLSDGILICTLTSNGLRLKRKLGPRDGLPSQVILQMLMDRDGQVWAANYHSVIRIRRVSQDRMVVSHFEKTKSLFEAPYHYLKMLQSDDGIIWLASTSGILKFDPRKSEPLPVPEITLSKVILYDQNKPVDTPRLESGFSLPHPSRSISFQYKAISFSHSGSIRYAYRLLGADTLWTDAGLSQEVKFHNLPPGRYVFEVRASVMNEPGSPTRISFTVPPGVWSNPWFIALLSLTGAALILLLGIRWRKKIQQSADHKLRAQQVIADNLQYRLETEKIINYFAISISQKQTEEELVWGVARNCISQLGFEDCVIYLQDEATGKLVQKAAWGPKSDKVDIIINPIEIPLGRGIVGSVGQNKKAEIVNDVTTDQRYIIDDVQRSSEIAVPILADGDLLGVIDSEHSEKNFFTPRHLQILTTIASLCADKITIIRTIAEKRSAEMEGMKSKQKATEALLQSMRLQMNPHFLFNALNSIQQMILTGDEAVATRSLSKFSRLLRTVLIQSDQEKISLSKELEILELYVELESLRFKETFEYSIYCDPKIDKDETLIPAMLIQPFVENAIWHGLMHKEGMRKLSVTFREEKNLMVCTIEDNGIGRQASQHIKEESIMDSKHTGKAIALARERLKIFGEHAQSNNQLQIIDEKDPSGKATGTTVIIRFPI